ncbi:MAG TPA: type IX secretion system sortase PorU [Bacteroidales bacterium]|nr:type IX secretion system sortase PorU [Bacteroidales bacterium]
MIRKSYIIFILLNLILAAAGKGQDKNSFAASSMLSSGTWFRIAVTEDGVYRIDFTRLKQLGLTNPSFPRIFGNNTGQLSWYNDGTAPDDLRELAVYLNTGSDGIFNEGDYLLFYGQGTGKWLFDSDTRTYSFRKHFYSDTAYYFLTSGTSPGRLIEIRDMPVNEPAVVSTTSDALFVYDVDSENPIHSGREWYHPVSWSKAAGIDPGFDNIITSEKISYSLRLLARSPSSSSFSFAQEGKIIKSLPVAGVDYSSATGTYARIVEEDGEFDPVSSSPSFSIAFMNNGQTSAKGWIDFLRLHARRDNIFNGRTLHIRDSKTFNPGTVTEFTIKNSSREPVIWDVTDPFSPEIIPFSVNNDILSFRIKTDTMRTFVAFESKVALIPVFEDEPVENQDLHASPDAEMIIVTHPMFMKQALKLAALHKLNSGLNSVIVTPRQIYNEFSGGIPDVVAIRNFVRMKYILQKESVMPLKYLLLFGDGSYDNKSNIPGNPAFIPTYQTQNSNVVISSFTTDDFFGLLEEGEGGESGDLDIGIGRLPVSDSSQASLIISKIEDYITSPLKGNWKNILCITADDEDGNTHLADGEGLARIVEEKAPWINTEKIYFDAFRQETSSTGEFYPDVEKAINDRINNGVLIFNYIGHGNELNLGHERVVTPSSISKWDNSGQLPLVITATCEFSRFDDMEINTLTGTASGKNSSGENILFSKGGAIALMSTTRLVYSAPNYTLNKNIFDIAFSRDHNGQPMSFGDIIKTAKNNSSNNMNSRNFVLLGDPALRLAWPWNGEIVTDSVNSKHVSGDIDTLKALSLVTISGHVTDHLGNILESYNGYVNPTVYGQEISVKTLANDGGSPVEFPERKNILFSGNTRSINGRFSFAFIVPRDIDYSYGTGRISYYGWDEKGEFKGVFSGITIGGFSNVNQTDTTGPGIKLFISDTLFRDGGITGSDPILLALINDPSGINATGKGIGHDLACWIDDDRSEIYILNEFFENDHDSYTSGKVTYRLPGLDPGRHTLTLKAWDNFNNSSEKSISFVVDTTGQFIIKNLVNYPNPFSELTRITAGHNRPGETIGVTLLIYDMSGRTINIIKRQISSSGYQLESLEWDGTNAAGMKAGRGIYPYILKATLFNGETATISGRMIIY